MREKRERKGQGEIGTNKKEKGRKRDREEESKQ